MTDAQMWAELFERGYTRDEIGDMDRGFISRIVGYPRDEKGRLLDDGKSPPPVGVKEITMLDKLRRLLRMEGLQDWQIDEEIRQFVALQYQGEQSMQQMSNQVDAFPGMYLPPDYPIAGFEGEVIQQTQGNNFSQHPQYVHPTQPGYDDFPEVII